MRIVAWNVAWNTRKRTHTQIEDLLSDLRPDVAVISETSRPPSVSESAIFDGVNGPGLTIYTKNGYHAVRLDTDTSVPRYFIPAQINGPISFLLLAAWPTKLDAPSYHNALLRMVAAATGMVPGRHTVLAGDLNSNSRVVEQQRTHPDFVKVAGGLGLVSAYHELGGYSHGQEPESTWLRAADDEHVNGFHLDYCFVSRPLLPAARVEIGKREKWRQLSDHLPVILDIPETNFAAPVSEAAAASEPE